MACKYYYIDDTSALQAGGTITGLEAEGLLSITHELPTGEWDKQIQSILDKLTDADGLILDQRLDEGESLTGNQSKYRGTSLAQEIRILTKEGKIADLPIILLSATANITGSFDNTGIDLFDKIISKERIPDIFALVRSQLVALAEGYQLLNKIDKTQISKSINTILGKDDGFVKNIDPRFTTKLESFLKSPTHIIANFIIKEILEKCGFLISEELLAARLGINIKESSDWLALLEILNFASYTGVFSSGWRRWWMSDIEDWWGKFGAPDDLRTTQATDRVKVISAGTGLTKLAEIPLTEYAKSTLYWTICQGTGNAIDIIDGLLIENQDDLFPWQDRQYVSYYAALRRVNSDVWHEVSALERPKLEKLQNFFRRDRPGR